VIRGDVFELERMSSMIDENGMPRRGIAQSCGALATRPTPRRAMWATQGHEPSRARPLLGGWMS
jgi:hypothetical protein